VSVPVYSLIRTLTAPLGNDASPYTGQLVALPALAVDATPPGANSDAEGHVIVAIPRDSAGAVLTTAGSVNVDYFEVAGFGGVQRVLASALSSPLALTMNEPLFVPLATVPPGTYILAFDTWSAPVGTATVEVYVKTV
jgi:hypothetical protein